MGRPRRRPGHTWTTANDRAAAEIDGSGCAGPLNPEREQLAKWACPANHSYQGLGKVAVSGR